MMREVGYCSGIENYSRHLAGRERWEPPWTLIDYFPTDFLLIVDESHITIPQIHGMYKAIGPARRSWSTSDSACHRRSTTGRSRSRSSRITSTR